MLEIVTQHEAWKSIRGLKVLAEKAVDAALPVAKRNRQITLLFSDDATLKKLNRDWRGKNKPTNVLSFPANPDVKLPRGEIKPLGDIALGYETIAKEAETAGLTLKAHTTHLIVHGVLHLLGYDHVDDQQAETMEAAEIKILSTLNIVNPYLS